MSVVVDGEGSRFQWIVVLIVGAEFDTLHPQIGSTPFQLFHAMRVEGVDGTEADESVGMGRDEFGDAVIDIAL